MQNCSPAISQTPSASEAPLRMDEGTFKMPRNAARELLDNRDDERIQIKRQVCSMEVVMWFTIIISNRLNMSRSLIMAFTVDFFAIYAGNRHDYFSIHCIATILFNFWFEDGWAAQAQRAVGCSAEVAH